MEIKTKTIVQGIKMLNNTYIGALDKIVKEEKDFKEMVKVWQEAFEVIEGDYNEVNEDFITAIKIIITNNKYFPTISEIIEEMKKIFFKREEEKENSIKIKLDRIARKYSKDGFINRRTINLYKTLVEEIGEENIEAKIKEQIDYENKIYNCSDRYINSLIDKVYEKLKGNNE